MATSGSRLSVGTRASPELRAISTTAVVPSPIAPQRAGTLSARGPVTSDVRRYPPDVSMSVSRVPSPPSATGTSATSASGMTRLTPSPMALATSSAYMLPLNESGAMTIFIDSVLLTLGRSIVSPGSAAP